MNSATARRLSACAGIAIGSFYALALTGSAIAGPYAYVPVASNYTVSVIDTATNTVVHDVPAGEGPIGVAVSPDGLRVYVASQNAHSMIVIDALTDAVVGTLALASDPFGLAVTPDGSQIYVTLSGIDAIAIVDAQSFTVVDTVEVGMTPRAIAFTPDGSKAYVANQYGGSVSVIDTQDNSAPRTLQTGGFALATAVNPAGTRVYVAVSGAGAAGGLFEVDTATDAIITSIPVGEARGVAVAPDGRVYVSHDDSVSIVNPGTNTVATTIPTGETAYGVSISRDGARAYVVNTNGHSVSVIDTALGSVAATIPLTGGAFSLGNFVGPPIMPHPPALLAASGRHHAIQLDFDAPRDGGSSIIEYTATCGAFSATGAASPLIVAGLNNGTTYSCSVAARNAIGVGPLSNARDAIAGVADAIFIDDFQAP